MTTITVYTRSGKTYATELTKRQRYETFGPQGFWRYIENYHYVTLPFPGYSIVIPRRNIDHIVFEETPDDEG